MWIRIATSKAPLPLVTITTLLWWTLLVVLLYGSVQVQSEIIELDIVIDASTDEVHFVRGYLKAPASIDLSAITFLTTHEPEFLYGDDAFEEMQTDDDVFNDKNDNDAVDTNMPEQTDAPTAKEGTTEAPTTAANVPEEEETREPVPDDNDGDAADATDTAGGEEEEEGDNANDTDAPDKGGDNPDEERQVPSEAPTTIMESTEEGDADSGGEVDTLADDEGDGGNRLVKRMLDDGSAKQLMDVVLFVVPEDCKRDSWGTCDWAKLGVGAYDEMMEGGMSYCCSADTAGRGLCSSDHIGTMIVNHSVFQGDHRKVVVPQSTDQEFIMEESKFDIDFSGDYVLVISNCNDSGLDVLALGNMEWKSVQGYLPGDMFELMLFYGVLTAVYFVIALWYYCGMRMYQDAAIPIQKYILTTMIIGFLEVLFRTTDFVQWNYVGLRSDGVMYTAMSLGVLKRGVSRCLGVMVAMGWGVVRDSLGSALVKIVFLGLLYSGLTLARDFFVVAAEDVQTISMSTKYYEFLDFAWVLTMLIIFINLVFYFWIIRSLNSTTEYLRNMNQTSKLKRHLRLRCLILTSLFIVALWLIVYIVQIVTLMLTQNLVWILEAVMHANYLFILVGVSILWRPNSHAKDYAMQMEVPALGGDDENELELSAYVPSADDMGYDDDGNDPDHQNGIRVDNAVLS